MNNWVQVCLSWMDENEYWVAALFIVFTAAIFTSPPLTKGEWLDFIPKRRGRKMRRARRQFVEDDAVDGFVNFIENRVYHEGWTREEAKEIYRRLKIAFPIRSLFPNPQLLKEKIKQRRAKGIHDPVPLVDKKPKRVLKHVFDKPKRVTL